MQQPCSNVVGVGWKLNVNWHREEIRRLVADAPDEPTYCEFKQSLSYANKKEKGELVKDVSSFANADLEALGGHGYIIFGVANDGRVVGIEDLPGDPPSDARKIINSRLDRPIIFEYLTCEVDDKAGGMKRVAAIIVPDSTRRPHVVSKEIKEPSGNKDRFWLRKGEVWVRGTAGRELATAEDFDAVYEGKLRRLVDDRVRPLRERIERLEGDLREQKSVAPELGFGLATTAGGDPSPEGKPYPVLGNLIDPEGAYAEIVWAARKAEDERRLARAAEGRSIIPSLHQRFSGRLDPEDYDEYARELEVRLNELQDRLVVDFVLANTGRGPAEDVEVVLEVPAELRPKAGWLEPLSRPQAFVLRHQYVGETPPYVLSKPALPDALDEPEIFGDGASGMVEARWQVSKVYHGRPLSTRPEGDYVNGLMISARGYKDALSRAGGRVSLAYVVRAANVPNARHGVVVLV